MITFAFLLSTIGLILQGILPLQISILAFSPFLALTILLGSYNQALFCSLIAGCLMDSISSDPIGVHALTYVIVSGLLFKIKNHFLYNEPFHLSLFTSIISLVITVFQAFFLFLFDRRVPLEGIWTLADFLVVPGIDGLYAFVCFALPLALFSKIIKMWNLFWLKRKRTSRILR